MSKQLTILCKEPYFKQATQYAYDLFGVSADDALFIGQQLKKILNDHEIYGHIVEPARFPIYKGFRLVKLEYHNNGHIVLYAYHKTRKEILFLKGFSGKCEDQFDFVRSIIDEFY